jgi:hypothetical protein
MEHLRKFGVPSFFFCVQKKKEAKKKKLFAAKRCFAFGFL